MGIFSNSKVTTSTLLIKSSIFFNLSYSEIIISSQKFFAGAFKSLLKTIVLILSFFAAVANMLPN